MNEISLRTMEIEEQTLSRYATLSRNTAGRARAEEPCPLRTAFQRDRDRIIHCKSFRRLKHKTQVFLAPERDHYRTRLTHTLEVAQIARTIARAMRVNEDLTEAIALGHDLGHTPFGHAGERALNACVPGGFKHYEQSARVVELLENHGRGLNLTVEVIDGIRNHTTGQQPFTVEGRIVRMSDRIAYINHDIDDAKEGGVICEEDIPKYITRVVGDTKSRRINTMVRSVIENSTDEIRMDDETGQAFDELYDFLYKNVYTNPVAKGEEGKAEGLVRSLYEYFSSTKGALPDEFAYIAAKQGIETAAADYIAGMTDRYATHIFEELFVPKNWCR